MFYKMIQLVFFYTKIKDNSIAVEYCNLSTINTTYGIQSSGGFAHFELNVFIYFIESTNHAFFFFRLISKAENPSRNRAADPVW